MINKVFLMGRLTADPELNEAKTFARYTLAVDTGKSPADDSPSAYFFNCKTFKGNAEFAEKFLHKGMKIFVEGSIELGSYVNKDGAKVNTTNIVVTHHEFCEGKGQMTAQNPINTDFSAIPEGITEELPFA